MNTQSELIRWIKEHKKALIAAGISVGVIIALVLGIKNCAAIAKLWAVLRNAIQKPAVHAVKAAVAEPAKPVAEDVVKIVAQRHESIPFEVSQHLRNLPMGWHASAEKAAEALEKGIVLGEHQTWVSEYLKGAVA